MVEKSIDGTVSIATLNGLRAKSTDNVDGAMMEANGSSLSS